MSGNTTGGGGQYQPQPSTSRPAESAKAAAEEGTERVKHEASRAAGQMQQQGEEIAAAAKERAGEFAREQKEAGAQQIDGVARAVKRAADELEQSSPELARYAREAASSVSGMSNALRERSVGDLFNEVNGFARREPAAFFGAAVVAGFALSRFLGSSSAHHHPSASEGSRGDDFRRSSMASVGASGQGGTRGLGAQGMSSGAGAGAYTAGRR